MRARPRRLSANAVVAGYALLFYATNTPFPSESNARDPNFPKAFRVPAPGRADRHAISASYSGTANLEAPGEAQVVAKTSGVMVQLLAEEGDQVHAGQVLARIDGDRLRLDLER